MLYMYFNLYIYVLLRYENVRVLLSVIATYIMKDLPHVCSYIYCILYYSYIHSLTNKSNSFVLDSYLNDIKLGKKDSYNHSLDNKFYKCNFRSSYENSDLCVFPVRNVCKNKNTPSVSTPPNSVGNSIRFCDIEAASQNTTMNGNCFNAYDPSLLGNIDPDIHYLHSANNKVKNTPYYNDQTFRKKFGSNTNLSMLHLNIRSIPDHFLELTSLLTNLELELKILAISETWIKPHHINYNIPNYNMEQDFRYHKRGGGVCLYLHNMLQYRLRDDLKIGNDPESINSIFIELDKTSTGTKHSIIIGCVYRPPWAKLDHFNELLNIMLESLHRNECLYLLGDFNVDLSHDVTTNLEVEEFKSIFSTHHCFPLICNPTREVKSSRTTIDQIFSNLPYALDTCDVGIIRTYISDHHAIFCILNKVAFKTKKQNTYILKRNFSDKNITMFVNFLRYEAWDIVYQGSAQEGFTWFQGAIDLIFDKCFQKRTIAMTYKNRLMWMTDMLRTRISEKNILGYEAFRCPGDLELRNKYKQIRNRLISDLRNAEIAYYSNELDIHKSDINRSWKILKTIIGKNSNKSKNKIIFSINNAHVTDCQIIANEFNNFFVSIGPQLASNIYSSVNPLLYVRNVVNSIVIPTITPAEIRTIILSTKNSSPGWDDIPASVAKKCIGSYIAPLTHVINNSILEGIFPTELKLARVVPLFKSGDSSKITNYRPISVLSFFSKIFERVMYNHILNFMDHNDSIYKHQFGFRQRHSTQQAIITLVVKITSSLDNGDFVIGVFLDLKKAFDTLTDHNMLPMMAYNLLFYLSNVVSLKGLYLDPYYLLYT